MKRIWIAALLQVSLAAVVAAAQSAAGTLSVQLVEPGWLPLPNMTIRITPVMNCAPKARPAGPPVEKNSDRSGEATFAVPGKGHYRIDVPKDAGFAARSDCVQLFDFERYAATAYVQVRLNFSTRVVIRH